MPQFRVQYYSNDRRGRVYTENGIEANSDLEAVALAAETFIQQGAQITSSSSYDVTLEDGAIHRIDGTALRDWLTRNQDGTFALLRTKFRETSNT